MDKETIIVNKKAIIGITAAIVLGLLWVATGGNAPNKGKLDKKPGIEASAKKAKMRAHALDEKQKRIKARLALLEKMTKKEWDAEGKALGDRAKFRPETLELAIKQNKTKLAKVEADIAALQAATAKAKENSASDMPADDKAMPAQKKGKHGIVDEDDDSDMDEGEEGDSQPL